MKAETMRWWMKVLHKNVYVQLGVAGGGVLVSMGSAIAFKNSQYQGFLFIFGIATAIIGIASCYLSAIVYDKLNTKLRAAETIERKEKAKEEKNARKSKKNKPDSS